MRPRTKHEMMWSSLRSGVLAASLLGPSALAVSVSQPASAEQAPPVAEKSANEVIHQMVDQAFAVLRDRELKNQPDMRVKKLREITDRAMDWDAMAKSSLGYHWQGLAETERADFVSIFKELLARQYRDDVDRFRGTERVAFGQDERKGDLITVKTTLTTASGEKVPINYTLHQVGTRWLVEDLSVEGVSMTNHYRKTFDRFLVNQPFANLVARLKQKLGWR
jgi:phospholipid transport system substrate-binding protein